MMQFAKTSLNTATEYTDKPCAEIQFQCEAVVHSLEGDVTSRIALPGTRGFPALAWRPFSPKPRLEGTSMGEGRSWGSFSAVALLAVTQKRREGV